MSTTASSLSSAIPTHWMSLLRPICQTANDFSSSKPCITFFLLKQAVSVAMMNRKTDKKAEENKFLKDIFGLVESMQKTAPPDWQLDDANGRTLLTKTGLQLFAQADDEEREGRVSDNTVRKFLASAVLFDATGQFLESKKPDGFAEEKSKYAKVKATEIARCLRSNVPYRGGHTNSGEGVPAAQQDNGFYAPAAAAPQQQPYPQQPPPPTPHAHNTVYQQPPQPVTQPPPQAPPQNFISHNNGIVPPPLNPPPQQQQQVYAPPLAPTAPPPSGGRTVTPLDQIRINSEAQKMAKYAVSALQFNDSESAKKYLMEALKILQQ